MDRSGIVKMFHCYTRGEINLFQQARITCSIVCVLRVYLAVSYTHLLFDKFSISDDLLQSKISPVGQTLYNTIEFSDISTDRALNRKERVETQADLFRNPEYFTGCRHKNTFFSLLWSIRIGVQF